MANAFIATLLEQVRCISADIDGVKSDVAVIEPTGAVAQVEEMIAEVESLQADLVEIIRVLKEKAKPKAAKVSLTPMQTEGLRAVIENSIDCTGGDFGFISEARPSNINKRSWPGVVGSLVRRGLIWTVPMENGEDSQCNPTKAGAQVALDNGWIDQKQFNYFCKDL